MTERDFLPHALWRPLPLQAVELTDGFLAGWQELNRRRTLDHGYQMLEASGTLDNFRIAAGRMTGERRGRNFCDSDAYKWLEAVGYQLELRPDADLQERAEQVVALIGAAQQADGYLNTYVQLTQPDQRWEDLDFGHELYCAGHLFQAAASYSGATGDRALLEAAEHLADLLASTFGPGQMLATGGHPEVELGLVDLYRATGNSAYLDLAKFFIDQRGQGRMRGFGWLGPEYHQDRVPLRLADQVEGHAVRAMYLNAGAADLYLETGEQALLAALERQWQDMVRGKLFLTGGLGSQYEGEAFGAPYELPPDQCYCETCAAIGSVFWNWRMLLSRGEGRFADLIERTLYNGVLSGLGMDGKHFFYMNPLLSRGDYVRQPWYEVACCPPNLMRLLGSVGQYLATRDSDGLQIHLFDSATVRTELQSQRPVVLEMTSTFPWNGEVSLTVAQTDGSAWDLRIRIPGWSPAFSAAINGEPVEAPVVEGGYLRLTRDWQLGDRLELNVDLDPFLVQPNPRVDATRGTLAIQRGPLVYCLEAVDHPEMDLMDVQLDPSAPLESVWQDELLPAGGVMTVQAGGYAVEPGKWADQLYRRWEGGDRAQRRSVSLTAIPYFAWANRGGGSMRVWIPRAE